MAVWSLTHNTPSHQKNKYYKTSDEENIQGKHNISAHITL
jgi:hypothetical protein